MKFQIKFMIKETILNQMNYLRNLNKQQMLKNKMKFRKIQDLILKLIKILLYIKKD